MNVAIEFSSSNTRRSRHRDMILISRKGEVASNSTAISLVHIGLITPVLGDGLYLQPKNHPELTLGPNIYFRSEFLSNFCNFFAVSRHNYPIYLGS